jgi:Phage terminase large subunit
MMGSGLVINEAFLPLFPRGMMKGAGVPPDVRYILDFSGRASGKSFASSCGLLCHTFEDSFTTLFSRYTMTSADRSIIPEFREKMDILGNVGSFRSTKTEIVNRESGGTIYFSGIVASSGNQTARLKSIPHLKMWINDESEELKSQSDFNTIDESIREAGAPNQVWLTGNPSDVTHWIYREFYLKRGVPYDFNGRVDDAVYIHTTYRSNKHNLSPSYLAKIRHLRETDYDAYAHRFLGTWLARKEGLIYKGWMQIQESDWPIGLPQWWSIDWGYSQDPSALLRICYDPMTGRLFVREVAYAQKMLVPDLAMALLRDAKEIGYEPWECRCYCDPARPDNRDQLRIGWGIDAVDGINKDKVGRIGYLQGFEVHYIGGNIKAEVENYSFQPSKTDPDIYTDKPQDGGDHAMDSLQYGLTHLRRMGVVNRYGENGYGEK